MTNIVINPSQTGTGQFSIDAPVSNNNRNFLLPDTNGTVVTTGSTAAVSQAMLAANVAGNGPAFSAYQSTAQSLANATATKIQFQTEEFDTNNNYDTTTFRFTPTVAGYYQVNAAVSIGGAAGNSYIVYLYKNGTEVKRGNQSAVNPGTPTGLVISALTLLNGTTDFIEIYAFQNSGAAQNTSANLTLTYFQAFLARAM